jgi:hypothetical protein
LELLQFLNHFFFRLLRHRSDVCIDVVIDGGLVCKIHNKLIYVIFFHIIHEFKFDFDAPLDPLKF